MGYDVSKCLVIDTLYLSWYLYPTRILHGLEAHGEEFGIPKPPIADWSTLTQEKIQPSCNAGCSYSTNAVEEDYERLLQIVWKQS